MSVEDKRNGAAEFDIPFPARTSPYLSWVRPRTIAWVREHDLVRSDEAERRLLSWNLPYAAARIYPNAATRDDLLKITNFFAVGFLSTTRPTTGNRAASTGTCGSCTR